MKKSQINFMPRIGDKAPSFQAMTSKGNINFPHDCAGKWTILFSLPADFTPVDTSELMTIASMSKEFGELNCQLIGLSVNGLNSHLVWLRAIKEKIEYKGMKNVEVTFPLIGDTTMEVANVYGMIQPGESCTKAVRAVFFIDLNGVIRAIIYYPLSLGRNFDELLRILIGLQTVDAFSVALPANWRPGDDVIMPTEGSGCLAKERMDGRLEDITCYYWFFSTKKLLIDEIKKALAKKGKRQHIKKDSFILSQGISSPF